MAAFSAAPSHFTSIIFDSTRLVISLGLLLVLVVPPPRCRSISTSPLLFVPCWQLRMHSLYSVKGDSIIYPPASSVSKAVGRTFTGVFAAECPRVITRDSGSVPSMASPDCKVEGPPALERVDAANKTENREEETNAVDGKSRHSTSEACEQALTNKLSS
jgi:hypothetical protein